MDLSDQISTITYGNGVLDFDVDKVIIRTEADTLYQGSFRIQVHTPAQVHGYICASDIRLQISHDMFDGKSLNVPFLYDTTGMCEQDTISGEIHVITNVGEFGLPYEVIIEDRVLKGELGEIRNLFHFANLARVNWEQALEVFANPLFERVLVGSGSQYIEDYRILLKYGMETGKMDSALDRFLIDIHKKQTVVLECGTKEYVFPKEEMPQALKLEIIRNGWGYTDARLRSDSKICTIDRRLTQEDFVNDRCELDIALDESHLHVGKNICRITEAETGNILCTIEVEVARERSGEYEDKLQKDMLRAGIMRLYLDYRTGRRPIRECFKTAEKLLGSFRGMDKLLPALYEAHLKLLRNKNNEAIWLLKNAKRMVKQQDVPADLYGYFLYLISMSGDDDRDQAADLLDGQLKEDEQSFSLFWACMHKDNLQYDNPAAVYRRLRGFFENGCTSPVLYLEAALIILDNELVLSAITDFEVQVLLFMDRYALLSELVCEQMYKLPLAVKKVCPPFLLLCIHHPGRDEQATDRMICRLYMKLDHVSADSAGWLKKGILSDCRINGLYEAYIRALDFDTKETLPDAVVCFFAYDTSLEDRYLAYVYEKVLKQKEELGAEYVNRIHDFVLRQLSNGRISRELAYLYRNILSIEDMNEDLQKQLQKLVFAHELTVHMQNQFKSCIVRQKGLKEQTRYTIKNGHAVVYLYTDDYTVMFEDQNGAVVSGEDGYRMEPLMEYRKMKELLRGCGNISVGEQLYLYEKKPLHASDTLEEMNERYKKYLWLLNREDIEPEFKKEMAAGFMRAFQRWDMHDECERMLADMDVLDFASGDRPEFINALAGVGLYEKAYKIICMYGLDRIPQKTLLGIAQYALSEADGYNEKLMCIVYRVFVCGKYTDDILQYLDRHFTGTLSQMTDIYHALRSMELSAGNIAQRLLKQEIFVSSYNSETVELFLYCCEHDAPNDLRLSYLDVCAKEYLIKDTDMEESLWEELIRLIKEGCPVSPVLSMAFLKYYSKDTASLEEEVQKICAELLQEFLEQDVFVSFFLSYTDICPVLELYTDHTYIEYYTDEHVTMMLHFVDSQDNGENTDYRMEEMSEVFPGIYQKRLQLFWGDSIPYYITRVVDGQEQFCKNGQLVMIDHSVVSRRGRYHDVNEIVMALALGNYELAGRLTEEYEIKKYLVEHILKIQ